MEQTVKFKVMLHSGKMKTITRTYSYEGAILYHLDSIDKSQFMDDNDIAVIIDYWVHEKKKKVKFEDYCKEVFKAENADPEIAIKFLEHYGTLNHANLKHVPFKERILLVFNSLNASLECATNAFGSLRETIKKENEGHREQRKKRITEATAEYYMLREQRGKLK